jgi:hypothetical protein
LDSDGNKVVAQLAGQLVARVRELNAQIDQLEEDLVPRVRRCAPSLLALAGYGNSVRVLGQIRNYALRRVALLLSKTGKRRRAWDWGVRQVLRSPDHLGLVRLDGAVIPPRPLRGWRVKRRR